VLVLHFLGFFVERDPTLSYPYILPNDQEVPSWLLFFLSLGVPFLILLAAQLFGHFFPSQILLPTHIRENHLLPFLTLFQSWGLTALVTELLKYFVGRKRPSFFAMCNYKGYRDALAKGDLKEYFGNTTVGLVGDMKYCLETDPGILAESQYSFPSGHSSLTYAGLTVVFWLLLHSIPLNSAQRDIWQFRLWRILPLILFLGSATIVACTRTRDYWHNFDDIVAGAIIGTVCATFIFYANTHLRREMKEKEDEHLISEHQFD